jgi:hypothetical protein
VLVVVLAEPIGFYAAAAVMAVLFAGEAAHGWIEHGRTGPAHDDDETDLEDMA